MRETPVQLSLFIWHSFGGWEAPRRITRAHGFRKLLLMYASDLIGLILYIGVERGRLVRRLVLASTSLGICVEFFIMFLISFNSSEPYKEKHQSRIDRMISNAISRLIRLQAKFLTKEQIKVCHILIINFWSLIWFRAQRRLEVMVKLNSAIEETLGIRKEEMVCLEIIVTSPKKQGRGYGSALGKIVTAVVSLRDRSLNVFCWTRLSWHRLMLKSETAGLSRVMLLRTLGFIIL